MTNEVLAILQQILTIEGIGLLFAIGMAGGGYLGAVALPAYPIIGLIAGATLGLCLPFIFHFAGNGLIKSCEMLHTTW